MLEQDTDAEISAFNWNLLGSRLRSGFPDLVLEEPAKGHLYILKSPGALYTTFGVQAQTRIPETHLFNVSVFAGDHCGLIREEDIEVGAVLDRLRRLSGYAGRRSSEIHVEGKATYFVLRNCTTSTSPFYVGGVSYA